MLKDIKGYISNNKTNFDVLRKLGFQCKTDVFSDSSANIIIESGHLWFADVIYDNGRFKGKELDLADVIKQINNSIDLDNSFCEASIGAMCYITHLGLKPSAMFSDDTKYFVFNTKQYSFSGVKNISLNEKRKISLTADGWINNSEPVLGLTKFKELTKELDIDITDKIKEALCQR